MIRVLEVGLLVLALLLGLLALVLSRRMPRTDREWALDQASPARVTLQSGSVRVEGLRDFQHEGPDGAIPRYRDETYDFADVRRVWFALAPFASRWRGLAHSFVSFEFTDDRFVAVSVEARREAGEDYSLFKGIMRGFELTYVIGTERDLIGLRALRGDTLYLYPSRATPAQAQSLLEDMLGRAEEVRLAPEFYNTLTNSCSTVLRDHVNRVVADPLPWGWGVIFPGYSDALALEHGLLDTELPIDAARSAFRIDARARAALTSGEDFSRAIRAGGGGGS